MLEAKIEPAGTMLLCVLSGLNFTNDVKELALIDFLRIKDSLIIQFAPLASGVIRCDITPEFGSFATLHAYRGQSLLLYLWINFEL